MTEGPDSRYALLNYPIDALFSNAGANFLQDTDTVKMINDILITSIHEYVEKSKNKFALETSQWDDRLQQEYKEMVEILFNKKQGRIFDLTNERFNEIAYELFDTFRISDYFPKLIREMSLVYMISNLKASLLKI